MQSHPFKVCDSVIFFVSCQGCAVITIIEFHSILSPQNLCKSVVVDYLRLFLSMNIDYPVLTGAILMGSMLSSMYLYVFLVEKNFNPGLPVSSWSWF